MATRTKKESVNKSAATQQTASAQTVSGSSPKSAVKFLNPFALTPKEERRKRLHELTGQLIEEAKATGDSSNRNQLLLRYYREQCGATVLRTLEAWAAQGKRIRKGAKAFLLWDKPQASSDGGAGEAGEPNSFFPMKYVFDIRQVYSVNG